MAIWVKRFVHQLLEDRRLAWSTLELVDAYADDCLSLLDLRMTEAVRGRRR